jgi:hypothetical protein
MFFLIKELVGLGVNDMVKFKISAELSDDGINLKSSSCNLYIEALKKNEQLVEIILKSDDKKSSLLHWIKEKLLSTHFHIETEKYPIEQKNLIDHHSHISLEAIQKIGKEKFNLNSISYAPLLYEKLIDINEEKLKKIFQKLDSEVIEDLFSFIIEKNNYNFIKKISGYIVYSNKLVQHLSKLTQWGYKGTLLFILKQIKASNSLSIPDFYLLSHTDSLKILHPIKPSLNKLWKKFIHTIPKETASKYKEGASPRLKIKKEDVSILKEIQKEIYSFFSSNSPQLKRELNEWVKNFENKHLNIRKSCLTPQEDDLSMDCITSTSKVISVLEYIFSTSFEEDQLQKKWLSQDLDFFNFPNLSLVLQHSPYKKEGLSINGSIKSHYHHADLTFVKASYGNKESLSYNTKHCDEYFISKNKIKTSTIRFKDSFIEFLNQDFEISCSKQEIPCDLKETSTLSNEQILYLESCSQKNQKSFSFPLNIEWSSSDNTGLSFWISNINAHAYDHFDSSKSSYLEFEDLLISQALPSHNNVGFELISWSQLEIIKVTSPRQIVCLPNLEQAYKYYTSRTKKINAKAIIIRQNTPIPKKHIDFFSFLQLPILSLDEISFTLFKDEVLTQSSPSLFIDIQQKIIFNCPFKLLNKQFIRKGTISFPEFHQVSLSDSSFLKFYEKNWEQIPISLQKEMIIKELHKIKKKFKHLLDNITTFPSQQKLSFRTSFSELFKLLTCENNISTKDSVKLLTLKLYQQLHNKFEGLNKLLSVNNLHLLIVLDFIHNIIENELLPSLSMPCDSFDRLIPISILETLFHQPQDSTTLYAFSLYQLLSSNQDSLTPATPLEKELLSVSYSKRLICLKLIKFSQNLPLSLIQNWSSWIKSIALKSPQSLDNILRSTVFLRDNLQELDLWITLNFSKPLPENYDIKALLRPFTSLEALLTEKTSFFQKIIEKKKILSKLKKTTISL